MTRTLTDVTPTRFLNHGYAARFIEEPFQHGSIIVEFEYRFGQNCYDARVYEREDYGDPKRMSERFLCRVDNILPGGSTREQMAESAHDIANAEA